MQSKTFILQTGGKVRDKQDQQWHQLLHNECACRRPQRLSHKTIIFMKGVCGIYALILRESSLWQKVRRN